MNITVLFFGLIAEKVNKESYTFSLDKNISISTVIHQLKETFKELNYIEFQTALNQKIVPLEEIIKSDCTIALLPPFAGG